MRMSLKLVQTANSGIAMGVAADNLIKSFKIASGFSTTNVAIEGDQFIDDNYRLRIV